jgi:predicted Zn-dependent protease with MMP-like domain
MREGEPLPDLEEFQVLVEEALDEFPVEFKSLIGNLAVVAEDIATPRDAARAGVRNPIHLLGLYTGVPFTQWGRERGAHLPDVIKIYRLPILSVVGNSEEIREKVRKIVLHELGHRAGMGEGRLRDLGVF